MKKLGVVCRGGGLFQAPNLASPQPPPGDPPSHLQARTQHAPLPETPQQLHFSANEMRRPPQLIMMPRIAPNPPKPDAKPEPDRSSWIAAAVARNPELAELSERLTPVGRSGVLYQLRALVSSQHDARVLTRYQPV